MKVDIEHRPAYAIAKVQLGPGEQVKADAGAMVAMLGDVSLQTGAVGGIGSALKRRLLGGESFWQNIFTAGQGGGAVHFAPTLPGDIVALLTRPGPLVVQDGSYLASAPSVQVDAAWGGFKTWASGEGFFLLRVTGEGPLLLNSYGAIEAHELRAGERLVLDTGHLVAFTEGLAMKVRRVGGLKSTLLSGEGLVTEFTGPGTVWMQTRSTRGFLSWLAARLPGGQ